MQQKGVFKGVDALIENLTSMHGLSLYSQLNSKDSQDLTLEDLNHLTRVVEDLTALAHEGSHSGSLAEETLLKSFEDNRDKAHDRMKLIRKMLEEAQHESSLIDESAGLTLPMPVEDWLALSQQYQDGLELATLQLLKRQQIQQQLYTDELAIQRYIEELEEQVKIEEAKLAEMTADTTSIEE